MAMKSTLYRLLKSPPSVGFSVGLVFGTEKWNPGLYALGHWTVSLYPCVFWCVCMHVHARARMCTREHIPSLFVYV